MKSLHTAITSLPVNDGTFAVVHIVYRGSSSLNSGRTIPAAVTCLLGLLGPMRCSGGNAKRSHISSVMRSIFAQMRNRTCSRTAASRLCARYSARPELRFEILREFIRKRRLVNPTVTYGETANRNPSNESPHYSAPWAICTADSAPAGDRIGFNPKALKSGAAFAAPTRLALTRLSLRDLFGDEDTLSSA